MSSVSTQTATEKPGSDQRKPSAKWTVMVFMGADNLPGDASLTSEAADDIKEMRDVKEKWKAKAAQRVNENRAVDSPDLLNIFVQLHEKGTATRHHIGVEENISLPMNLPDDATNGRALIKFVDWALRTAGHKRTDYSMLVLWGHAYRFGIGPQTTRHGVDALDFAELATVLKGFQEQHRIDHAGDYAAGETPKLDIDAFDSCDLATLEMAYQIHPFAKYFVASQIGVPLPGWPYDRVLDRLQEPHGRMMGPAELGTYIARRFCASYQPDKRSVCLSVLDLKRANDLFDLTETLARTLAIAIADDEDELSLVSDLFVRARTGENKPFIDVAELCLNLHRYSSDSAVAEAAKALGDVLVMPYPDEGNQETRSVEGLDRPFIVENARNSAETAALNGVSLYAPHVATSHDFETASFFYEKFVFAQKTLWCELVRALALPS